MLIILVQVRTTMPAAALVLVIIEARYPSRVYQGAHARADGVSNTITTARLIYAWRSQETSSSLTSILALAVWQSSPPAPSSRPSGLHQRWGTRQRRGASCSSSTSTASPWPGRWRNSSTPHGNLACASVFLVEPTGLHHAGDDLAIVFVFLVVCTKPSADWSS